MAETAKRERGKEPVEGWRDGSGTALGALAEVRSLVPCTSTWPSDGPVTLASGDRMPSSGLGRHCTHARVPKKVVEHSFGKLYVAILSNVFRSNSHPVLPYYRWGS